jgi:ankyrin repeat protein
LEQGADPLIFSQGSQNPAHDLPHYAIAGNTPGVLRYLFQHYGSTFFYQQVEDKTTATPLWRHLEFAIEMNRLEITNFLFNEVGFLPHAKGRKFDAAWYSCTHFSKDNSAITALLMKHNLLKKLDSALYYAIGQGAMPAIKQILTQKPKLDTEKLFKAYFNCPKKKKPEFIDLMLNLFAAQKEVPALALKEIINQLIHMLRLAPQEGDPKQQAMVLALLPALFTRLHGYNLPSEAELRAQPIYQLSHEGQQELLYRVLYEVALANSPKTLKTLLAAGSFLLGSQPLLVSFLHEISKKVVKYEATISLLVDAGGESLAYQTPDYYQDYSPHRSYEKYTALHFLCELGTNKQIRHLIEKMVAEHCSLDAICHKKVRKSRTAPFTVYHYTALHFALEQGQQEVAVKLVEAGADFTIKAVVERPSTYFYNYFPRMNKSETTPLQIAIEQKQIAVLRALQLKMLDSYIVQRSKEEIYLSHITLFGYTFFRFGFFHKTTKLDAAEDYRKALLRGEVDYQELDKLHRGALSQGRLGAITQLADTIKENLDAHQKPTVKI